MSQPAARLSDMHTCPMVTPGVPPVPHVGGPIVGPCAPTVLIGGMPAARVTDMAICVGPPDAIAMGSSTVLLNGLMAARMGDPTTHGGVIVFGWPTVLIGNAATVGGGAASSAQAGSAQGRAPASLEPQSLLLGAGMLEAPMAEPLPPKPAIAPPAPGSPMFEPGRPAPLRAPGPVAPEPVAAPGAALGLIGTVAASIAGFLITFFYPSRTADRRLDEGGPEDRVDYFDGQEYPNSPYRDKSRHPQQIQLEITRDLERERLNPKRSVGAQNAEIQRQHDHYVETGEWHYDGLEPTDGPDAGLKARRERRKREQEGR